MESMIYTISAFILAIVILVGVHEFGHFWVARKYGVKVLKFSIGFGKPIFTWRRKNDPTEYSIGLIPLGGYVKMLDEREGSIPEHEREFEFNNKSLTARSMIVFAGPAFNFLFAIFAIWLTLVIGSRDYAPVVGQVLEESVAEQVGFELGDQLVQIDGRPVKSWRQHQLYLMNRAMQGRQTKFTVETSDNESKELEVDFGYLDQQRIVGQPITSIIGIGPPPPPAKILNPVIGMPADRAGLISGDLITSLDDEVILDWVDLANKISTQPGKQTALTVIRDGQEFEVMVVPDTIDVNGTPMGRIGIYRPEPEGMMFRLGPVESMWQSVEQSYLLTIVTLKSIGRMITAQMSADNLSGPITIARVAGRTAESGVTEFLSFLALISISLGLLNLLPIPILDGGHLLYFLYEGITGKKPSEEAQLIGQKIGISAIILLTIFAFYNDIMRLF
ncbi:MAG: RIP metalloprotease RseP [Gammaproteobacteria bacterium]|nr:RIP metalloprotease RseP [Gammaproteobacteria bacterium]MCY4217777.1 RIP metalloprotease RseP [Gammaproteobacteria bacterium]MCY4274461.1 RIP metalloprotease RseP [Gammaproteobacteria bacterium]